MTIKAQRAQSPAQDVEALRSFASELVRQVEDYGRPFESQVRGVLAACEKFLGGPEGHARR